MTPARIAMAAMIALAALAAARDWVGARAEDGASRSGAMVPPVKRSFPATPPASFEVQPKPVAKPKAGKAKARRTPARKPRRKP